MKIVNSEYSIIAIGTPEVIKPIEKSMRRAWRADKSAIWPSHLGSPRYNPGRIYGIGIEHGDLHDTYYILSADTVLRTLFNL